MLKLSPLSSTTRPTADWLDRLDLRRLSFQVATSIAALDVLGVLHALGRNVGWLRLPGFGLDEEWSVPAFFSGALLVGAAVACLLSLRAGGLPGVRTGVLTALAVFFTFMAVDEVVQIHERLEDLTNVGWQLLYLPLIVVGAIAWLLVLRGLRAARAGSLLFIAGAMSWGAAQLFESVQRDGAVLVHRWTILPEETLEMVGSALFAVALLAGAQAALRARRAQAE